MVIVDHDLRLQRVIAEGEELDLALPAGEAP
jgi:hypothetical protein